MGQSINKTSTKRYRKTVGKNILITNNNNMKKAMLIKLTDRVWKVNLNEIQDRVSANWKIDKRNMVDIEYVLPLYKWIIRDVFKVKWFVYVWDRKMFILEYAEAIQRLKYKWELMEYKGRNPITYIKL